MLKAVTCYWNCICKQNCC